MSNGLDIRRVEYNPMYRAKKHIAEAQDYISTQRQVQDAQLGRTKQKGAMSLWSTVGAILASYFGPGGAAIGAGTGSALADLYYSKWGPGEDVEGLKIDEPLFGKSKVDVLNQQLAAADDLEMFEHIETGITKGAQAWTLGEAANLGGFGDEGVGLIGDKLWSGYWS